MTPIEIIRNLCGSAKWQIEHVQRGHERLEEEYKACRFELFTLKNNANPQDVIRDYNELASSCCISRINLNEYSYFPRGIKICDKCTPTKPVKDAYFAIHGKHLIINEF